MTETLNELTERLCAARAVSDADVLALRAADWSDGALQQDEVAALFAINDTLDEPNDAFTDFFAESLSVLLLEDCEPRGYVSEAHAVWLVSQIGRDGRVETHAELEALVRVIERALNAPDSLKQWVLEQIEAIVLTGQGPTRREGDIRPGTVDAAEVGLLRRLVFAGAGEGAAIVGAAEGEALFRIKDATLGGANADCWDQFFVQAIANHLLAWSNYTPLARDRAAQLESFMNDNASSIGGFLARIGQSLSLDTLFGAARQEEHDIDAEVAQARQLTPDEAAWLKRLIAVDGATDDLEKAVLAFIVDEGVLLPEDLTATQGPVAQAG